MKLFSYGKDGGSKSTVTGFWLIELKNLFSIVILRFGEGSREIYHSHAFNAVTWWLRGQVTEHILNKGAKIWRPSLFPKFTPRSCIHKVFADKLTYAISFRGPWSKTWKEFDPKNNKYVTLTHGRRVVNYNE